jgi:hypothetical protein
MPISVMARRRLRQPRLANRRLESALQHGLVEMMTTANACLPIDVVPRCRKHPLPPHSHGALGYFTASASGNHTLPAPAARSASCCAFTEARCTVRCGTRARGSIVRGHALIVGCARSNRARDARTSNRELNLNVNTNREARNSEVRMTGSQGARRSRLHTPLASFT